MKKSLVILSVLIISTMLFVGCVQPEEVPEEKVNLVLGAEASLLPASVWVAENQGYFLEEGLNLTIKEFGSGRLSFLDMLEDGVDISTVAPTPIMFNSFERQDFSIFATFVYAFNDVKVIANQDSNIRVIADLVGKKIGTPAGTTGQFFVEAFLTYNEIDVSEVMIVDIPPANLPGALNAKEVDTIVIWEPHAYNAQELLGAKAIRLPSSEIYKETFNFMVMNDFAKENSETLEKFTRAIVKATEFIQNNKNESQKIVAQRLKLDETVTNILWEDFVFEVSLEPELITTLEDEAKWAIDSNLTDKKEVPNYLNYVYSNALKQVDSSLVTINK
jgi:ABC-type nitrate/sulfonate/bicarbonate transport system substrate-binding protein